MKPALALAAFVVLLQTPWAIEPRESETPGSIYGRVTNPRTGEALPHIQVFIAEEHVGATTGEQGQFLIRDLPLGETTVRFHHNCYLPVTVQVNLTQGMIQRGVEVGLPRDLEMWYEKGCDRRIG